MKRTGIKRGTSQLKRTPLARTSKKKAKTGAAWWQVRAEVLRRDGGCRLHSFGIRHRCFGGLEVHHVLRRSQGGTDDLTNLVTLCGAGHQWVHEHPAHAVELGLLRRLHEPEES